MNYFSEDEESHEVEIDLYERRQRESREREEEEDRERESRRICPDCGGTNLNYINPEDGGGCPSCFNGYV